MQPQYTLADVARFWAKVEKTDACWLSTYAAIHGYPAFPLTHTKAWRASRFAWLLATGEDPGIQRVCHTCDVKQCVRNDDEGVYIVRGVSYRRVGHLFLADDAANAADKVAKGRSLAGDRNPSKHYPERLKRGEQNARSRFTAEQVLAMREAYAQGAAIRELARTYGAARWAIQMIVHRRTWRHI